MTDAATPLEDTPHWARPLLERQVAVAGQLAEGGLELAMAVKDQALAPDGAVEPQVIEGLSRAYARIARATRLSLMLQERLIKDLIAFDKKLAFDADWARTTRRLDTKAKLTRILDRVIERQESDPEEAERLSGEAFERLDSEDIYGDILDRPVSELVAMICRDLGLDLDLSPFAAEAWAMDEAGWPFQGDASNSSSIGGGGALRGSVTEGENRESAKAFGHPPPPSFAKGFGGSPSPDGGGMGGGGAVLAPP